MPQNLFRALIAQMPYWHLFLVLHENYCCTWKYSQINLQGFQFLVSRRCLIFKVRSVSASPLPALLSLAPQLLPCSRSPRVPCYITTFLFPCQEVFSAFFTHFINFAGRATNERKCMCRALYFNAWQICAIYSMFYILYYIIYDSAWLLLYIWSPFHLWNGLGFSDN